MVSLLAAIVATLITMPLVGYIITFIVYKQLFNNHRRAVLTSIDVTTILLIVAVHFIIVTIWGKSQLPLILLLMLIIAVVYALYYWKTKTEMELLKLLRGYWRLNFLLFLISYIILVLYGIIARIIT